MKKLLEVKRGKPVPDDAKLVKLESKTTYERPPQGGDLKPVVWDLFEVPVKESENEDFTRR